MSTQKVYEAMASLCQAIRNCEESGNSEWKFKHTMRLRALIDRYLPHGGGFDGQITVDTDKSDADRIVLGVSFHHMNDNGMYDGWTDHNVTVKPSLAHEIYISVSGRDRNDIKNYIGEEFHNALCETVDRAEIDALYAASAGA